MANQWGRSVIKKPPGDSQEAQQEVSSITKSVSVDDKATRKDYLKEMEIGWVAAVAQRKPVRAICSQEAGSRSNQEAQQGGFSSITKSVSDVTRSPDMDYFNEVEVG